MRNQRHESNTATEAARTELTLALGMGPLGYYQLRQQGMVVASDILDLDPDRDFWESSRYDGAPHVLALLSDLNDAHPNLGLVVVKQWDFGSGGLSSDDGMACVGAVRSWARQNAVPLVIRDMESWLAACEKAAG